MLGAAGKVYEGEQGREERPEARGRVTEAGSACGFLSVRVGAQEGCAEEHPDLTYFHSDHRD